MQQAIDLERFEYIDHNGRLAHCRLRVYEDPDRALAVIASEVSTNPGASVTDSWEILAVLAWQLLERRDPGVVWIEHYDTKSYAGVDQREEFSLVTFRRPRRFKVPEWKHISRGDVEMMLDGATV